MEVRAHLGRVRVSARKARLVVDTVRGRPVLEAQAMLRFIPNKTAFELEKLMKSLAANAENNYDLDPRDLYIKRSLRTRGQRCAGSGPRPAVVSVGSTSGRAASRSLLKIGEHKQWDARSIRSGFDWESSATGNRSGLPNATTPPSCTRTSRSAIWS